MLFVALVNVGESIGAFAFHVDFSASVTNLLLASCVMMDGGWLAGCVYAVAPVATPSNFVLSAPVMNPAAPPAITLACAVPPDPTWAIGAALVLAALSPVLLPLTVEPAVKFCKPRFVAVTTPVAPITESTAPEVM